MSLMCDHLSTLVPAFDGKGGVRTIFKMLGSNSQMIQPQSLNSCFAFLLALSTNSSAVSSSPMSDLSFFFLRTATVTGDVPVGVHLLDGGLQQCLLLFQRHGLVAEALDNILGLR